MKTLIIGATGSLAKPLIEHLKANEHKLRLFSRNIDPDDFNNAHETIKGDVFNPDNLNQAMEGIEAIHINLDKLDEAKAAENIVQAALQNQIKLISIITGSTVCEENRWSRRIDTKYRAEQALIQSDIPYLIFRPSWFFESLEMMIRSGKAMLIGKHPKPFRWVAGEDYGRMVAEAYEKPETYNKIFYVQGPEPCVINELMPAYCSRYHPEIKKVQTIPLGMIKLLGYLSGKKELREAADLFKYFETVDEPVPEKGSEELLGLPQLSFEQWMDSLVS